MVCFFLVPCLKLPPSYNHSFCFFPFSLRTSPALPQGAEQKGLWEWAPKPVALAGMVSGRQARAWWKVAGSGDVALGSCWEVTSHWLLLLCRTPVPLHLPRTGLCSQQLSLWPWSGNSSCRCVVISQDPKLYSQMFLCKWSLIRVDVLPLGSHSFPYPLGGN